jgi:Metallo-peptidase family M12
MSLKINGVQKIKNMLKKHWFILLIIAQMPILLLAQKGVSFDDIETMPICTINMRFHFMPRLDKQAQFTPQEARAIAQNMVKYANQNLSNLNPANIPAPNGKLPAHVKDSRLRLHLYSETNDEGVVIHEKDQIDLNDPYDGRVVDVYFVYCYSPNEKGDSLSCCFNQAVSDTRIEFCNVWKVLATDTAIQNNRSRLLVHELGHILGLSHTFSCGNECENEDIDPKAECGGPCEWVGDACAKRGNNIMSYRFGSGNDYNTALTPCQWAHIFNKIMRERPQSRVFDQTKDNNALLIEEDETWDSPKILNCDVIVDYNAKLTIRADVHFTEGCTVYVRRWGKVILESGELKKLKNSAKWSIFAGKGKFIEEKK